MMAFLKKHFFDGVAILSALILSITPIIILHFSAAKENLTASIYRSNALLMEIDLSKESEERTFVIQGAKSEMTIGVKKDAIAVLEAGCLTHSCVHQGYVSDSVTPIICAYNEVIIQLSGGVASDVVIR